MIRLFRCIWTVLFAKKPAPLTDQVVVILTEHRYLVALEAAFFVADMLDAFRIELHEGAQGQKSEFLWLGESLLSVKDYLDHTTRSPLVLKITPEQDKQMIDLLIRASERLSQDLSIYNNILAYEVIQLVLDVWCDSIEYPTLEHLSA